MADPSGVAPPEVSPHRPAPRQRTQRPSHFVICGFDGLTFRLAEQLTDRYDTDVVVIMTTDQQKMSHDFSDIVRARVTVVDRIDERLLREIGVAGSAGLALT